MLSYYFKYQASFTCHLSIVPLLLRRKLSEPKYSGYVYWWRKQYSFQPYYYTVWTLGGPGCTLLDNKTHDTLSSSNSEYLTYDNSEFFFTCGPGKEKRRLIMGALIQNLDNMAPVRNSIIVVHHYIIRSITYQVCNIHSCTMFAQMESIFLTG